MITVEDEVIGVGTVVDEPEEIGADVDVGVGIVEVDCGDVVDVVDVVDDVDVVGAAWLTEVVVVSGPMLTI
jgi:hypothetical protein